MKTVPAEGVLAVFTHHLGATFVSFYVDMTHWTLFDGSFGVMAGGNTSILCFRGHEGLALLTRLPWMPAGLADGAKLYVAGGALYWHSLVRIGCINLAHGLTLYSGAPRPGRVQMDFSFKFQLVVQLKQISWNQTCNLCILQDPIFRASQLWARDRRSTTFSDHQFHILRQALGAEEAVALLQSSHSIDRVFTKAEFACH